MLFDRCNQNPVTQTFLQVKITLKNSLASLILKQTFKNTTNHPLEVSYAIPLDPNLVITDLQAIFEDGSIIQSKIIQKDHAKQKFQDKLSKGHLPVLASSQYENLEICIGHLPSKQSLSVEVGFAFTLLVSNNCWKFEMPEGFYFIYDRDCEVELLIESDEGLAEWKSNWDFDFCVEGHSVKGFYQSELKGVKNERLEVLYKSSESISPRILVQFDGEQYAAALSFIPNCLPGEDIDEYEHIGEFLFVIDRSGSMAGSSISLAKEAAEIFLKSLNHKSKFNIISFGSSYSFLYPTSIQANTSNVSDAISKISHFSSDFGGTEIFEPLSQIYQKTPDPDFPRFIFLLTDGEVSFREKVLELISNNSEKGKLFTFGIGEADMFLIQGAAKNGNGESFCIKDETHIAKNVVKALETCISPFISEFEINWDCEFAPKLDSIKSVTYERRFCVFALASSLQETDCVLSYFDSFKNRKMSFKIESKRIIEGNEIFKLWAKQKILDDCEKSLDVSLKYQVLSPKTAYFCSKKSQDCSNEEILPINITHQESNLLPSKINFPTFNYCHSDDSLYNSLLLENEELEVLKNCPLPDEDDEIISEKSDSPDSHSEKYEKPDLINNLPKNSSRCAEKLEKIDVGSDSLIFSSNLKGWKKNKEYLDVVLCQESEGFWLWEKIISVIGGTLQVDGLKNQHENLMVVATSLALAFLNRFCLAHRDEWRLVEKKAVKWIKNEYSTYKDLVFNFSDAFP